MDAKRPPTIVTAMKEPSFNPRARDGREDCPDGSIVVIDVSIHAPVMDANA